MGVHQPPDALHVPRFTGPRTFARLPNLQDLTGVSCAVFGMPWDGGTSFRSGARFGPEGIRSASGMIRTFHPDFRTQVFGVLSTIDYGDSPTAPGYIEDTLERIADFMRPIVEAGVIPIGMGGDHSVTLAELRVLAKVWGPVGLIQLDAHQDVGDTYFGRPYGHGTMFRRAIEEGILDPARFVQAGMRGSLYGKEDESLSGDLGVEMIPWRILADMSPAQYAERVHARLGDGPAFLTFDVDFLDPAFAPGTGTPEVGGPTSYQALQYLRALDGLNIKGFDVVEVAPPYDGPGQLTALLAANVIFDMLALVVRSLEAQSAKPTVQTEQHLA